MMVQMSDGKASHTCTVVSRFDWSRQEGGFEALCFGFLFFLFSHRWGLRLLDVRPLAALLVFLPCLFCCPCIEFDS